MKKVLLFLLIAQGAYGMLQERDGVSVIIRKSPLLIHNTGYKNKPVLLTVINYTNVPLFISPASFSRPLFTFTQAYAGFNQVRGIRVFNAVASCIACIAGGAGSVFGWLILSDNVKPLYKPLCKSGGFVTIYLFTILGCLALLDTDNKITISGLESYYLYLPTMIPPSTSLDKLIWLQDEKPNDLKISLFLPDNTSLDFNFTADQLAALA